MKTLRLAALVVACALAAGLFTGAGDARAQSAKTTLEDPEQATRFNEISDRLVCQCGCQMILRVCNHQNCPSATPMRHQIEKRILEGKDDDEIVEEFVGEMGIKVLSTPPAEGINLAAWVMPGFAVIIGIFIVIYFVNRMAARRRLVTAMPAKPSAAVDTDVRTRIEKELSDMER